MKKISFLPAAAGLAVFAGAVAWLWLSLADMNRVADAEQLEAVRRSVENGITMCYSIEGQYPENLDYLTEGYGVVYDETKYLVHYECFAANVRPSVTVVERTWS